jgi:hypothetical protein
MGDVQNHRPSRPSNDHARHDRPLVARFAAQDAYPTEVDEAQALVQRCADCAALAADVRALMQATAQLPPIPRPRDFRLTAEQAEQLRGSTFERFLRRLSAPRLNVLRPVAGVALSVGLVMAVVGAAGQPMAMPASLDNFSARDAAATDAPAMAPLEEPMPEVAAGGEDSGVTTDEGEREIMLEAQPPATDPNSLLLYVGLMLAVAGGGALLLLWFARRQTRDPLLR